MSLKSLEVSDANAPVADTLCAHLCGTQHTQSMAMGRTVLPQGALGCSPLLIAVC
jgi:hypothetical protein